MSQSCVCSWFDFIGFDMYTTSLLKQCSFITITWSFTAHVASLYCLKVDLITHPQRAWSQTHMESISPGFERKLKFHPVKILMLYPTVKSRACWFQWMKKGGLSSGQQTLWAIIRYILMSKKNWNPLVFALQIIIKKTQILSLTSWANSTPRKKPQLLTYFSLNWNFHLVIWFSRWKAI